jgi:transcriptional regulator with XRE-family HTH domain
MNQTIGQRIKLALNQRGMRQSALADAIGTSGAAVSAWVADRKPPKPENVEAIAAALGVEASWLQFGKGEGPVPDPDDERDAYRSALEWYWQETPKDGQRVLGDPAGHVFELRPHTLIRETGQNTLDELLAGEQTVELEYTIIELEGKEARRFLETLDFDSNLRGHLEACAQEGRRKHAAVIDSGLKKLDNDGRLRLIRIADYGANGLTGPEYDSGRFTAVCRNTLDSFKGGNESAGGSYGLGKATMWTASWMGVVITNSTLSIPQGEISDNRFFVRAELPWHSDDSKEWNGPGWFGEKDVDRGCTRSYAGNSTLAKDLLVERPGDRPGTTFLIVGAYDPSGEADDDLESLAATIRKEVAENFWAAMVRRGDRPPRLRAVVRTQRGREQLSEQVVDPADYVHPMVETLTKFYGEEQVESLGEVGDVVAEPVMLRVPKRRGADPHPEFEHEATLLIAQTDEPADSDSISRVVYLRGNNMTIRDYKLTPLPLGAKQFNAVLLAGLAAGDSPQNRQAEKFLRAAEPPAHNRWQGTPDLTSRYARGGASTIKTFEQAVKNAIREAIRDRGGGGDEGPEPLKELLRLLEPPEKHTRPRVKKISPQLDSATGAWTMEAIVSVPPGDRWSFAPVLRFGTESGPPIAVGWKTVSPLKRCQAVDGRLQTDSGARTVVFRAESDPATYPVRFDRARVRLDLGRVHRIEG